MDRLYSRRMAYVLDHIVSGVVLSNFIILEGEDSVSKLGSTFMKAEILFFKVFVNLYFNLSFPLGRMG